MKWITLPSLLAVILAISCKQKPEVNATVKGHRNLSMDHIPLDTARQHVLNYENKLSLQNDASDTRSVWFPINELREFLNYSTANDSIDGVRFYFAAYGQKPDAPHYSDRNTLILVLTKDSGEYHKDYYTEILEPTLKKPSTSPANQGELCPQNCAGAYLLPENP
jgi:hypothetical protein